MTDDAHPAPLAWPSETAETRPWTRWWWPGDAVAAPELERELSRLDAAGLGGVEVTPIYGVEGEEHRTLPFLGEDWLDCLGHVANEARRRGMAIDFVPGTGWHFGGPEVGFEDSAMTVEADVTRVGGEARVAAEFDPERLQAVVAYADDGRTVDLADEVGPDGDLSWAAPAGDWAVLALVGQRGRDVKRAAPDGQGPMLGPYTPGAMRRYLRRVDRQFDDYDGPPLRGTFHDSFEFDATWSPVLADRFEAECDYPLEAHLPALLGEAADVDHEPADAPPDYAARVGADYRRVCSSLYADFIREWTRWNHRDGRLARFQAHCAPGHMLDLYALADVPETEFIDDRGHVLASKIASSAAHVSGSDLVSAETATWLDEHFTASLAALKSHVDDLFLAGINHVVYHGTAYSPDDAPWPGWLFYASTQLNPRNPVWRDLPAVNEYVARCQSVLQAGDPDADVLLYWPVADVWHREDPLDTRMPVLERDWFESYPFGRLARELRDRGYTVDYVSDRQLRDAGVDDGRVALPGGEYAAVVLPETEHLPVETLRTLRDLAADGATVGFDGGVPEDVPGLRDLAARREHLAALREEFPFADDGDLRRADVGDGRVFVGDPVTVLDRTAARREPLVDEGDLQYVRRSHGTSTVYFLVNTGDAPVERWVPLATDADAVARLDPMRDTRESAAVRDADAGTEVFLQLGAGESVVLRALPDGDLGDPAGYWTDGEARPVDVTWDVEFVRGGPERPPGTAMDDLRSWTGLSELHERFCGTARYEATVDVPVDGEWTLDLGDVRDSATVWVDGDERATVVDEPFRVPLDGATGETTVVVEVTNRAANRVRDLDARDVDWKRFGDINFVGRDYEPFDASGWDVRPAGLLGPVELVERRSLDPTA